MAIQYPKLEHVTLPSVESWGGSLNILRDPPKSIFTKRNDRVGQTSNITEMIDSSTDRTEGISVYARGVNPMVSVSYDNNSNRGGSMNNGLAAHGGTQASLPYRLMDRGAFRPPIRTEYDLLPLSRQPRAWFSTMSNPGFVDYRKQKYTPTKFRMIKDMLLKTAQVIQPNKSIKMETPIVENYKMKKAINDKHINIEGHSGTIARDISNFTRENTDRSKKSIKENYQEVNAQTNLQQNRSHTLDDVYVNTEQYINDVNYHEEGTNLSKSMTQGLSDLQIDNSHYIQETLQGESNTNPSLKSAQGLSNLSIDQHNYTHDKVYADAITNKSRDINAKTIDQLQSNNKTSIKDIEQFTTTSGKKTGYTLQTVIPDMDMARHTPYHTAQSAKNDPRVFKRIEHENELVLERTLPQRSAKTMITKLESLDNFSYGSSRDVKLPDTLQKGQFLNAGTKPTMERSVQPVRMDTQKEQIRKYLNETQFSRDKPSPYIV